MNKKFKKILILLFICFSVCTLFNYFPDNIVYAEINTNYGNPSATTVDSSANEQGGNGLLGLVGIAIYSFGTLIEWITSNIMGLFTGTSFFPWADRIIFNNVSMLDVNFINPAEGSLFRDTTGFTTIGNAVRGVYFTGISIALGFLGIVVAVMAIKIALSTIASEKAKYKESIKDWITAIILIFGMHYVLAFTFYLNEKLVEVASQIVLNMNTSSSTATTSDSPLVSMGENFKNSAIPDEFKEAGIIGKLSNLDKINVTEAILYTVLVVQSLMFLFAYLKRFFYVVILGVIAPFVVVYDFLTKVL